MWCGVPKKLLPAEAIMERWHHHVKMGGKHSSWPTFQSIGLSIVLFESSPSDYHIPIRFLTGEPVLESELHPLSWVSWCFWWILQRGLKYLLPSLLYLSVTAFENIRALVHRKGKEESLICNSHGKWFCPLEDLWPTPGVAFNSSKQE